MYEYILKFIPNLSIIIYYIHFLILSDHLLSDSLFFVDIKVFTFRKDAWNDYDILCMYVRNLHSHYHALLNTLLLEDVESYALFEETIAENVTVICIGDTKRDFSAYLESKQRIAKFDKVNISDKKPTTKIEGLVFVLLPYEHNTDMKLIFEKLNLDSTKSSLSFLFRPQKKCDAGFYMLEIRNTTSLSLFEDIETSLSACAFENVDRTSKVLCALKEAHVEIENIDDAELNSEENAENLKTYLTKLERLGLTLKNDKGI